MSGPANQPATDKNVWVRMPLCVASLLWGRLDCRQRRLAGAKGPAEARSAADEMALRIAAVYLVSQTEDFPLEGVHANRLHAVERRRLLAEMRAATDEEGFFMAAREIFPSMSRGRLLLELDLAIRQGIYDWRPF